MASPRSCSTSSEALTALGGTPEQAAVALLGWELTTIVDGEPTSVRIIEVEAYGGADDPASHPRRGRTPRNGSMFGPPGTLYTYRSYGIHTCATVVVATEGTAGAVLIRAGQPVAGQEVMTRRRGRPTALTDGPGKLCQALGIALHHDGLDLLDPASVVRLRPGSAPSGIRSGPRVGISRGVDTPWRFVAEPTVVRG